MKAAIGLAALLTGGLAMQSCRLGGGITAQPLEASAPTPYVAVPTIAAPAVSPYYTKTSSITITGACMEASVVQLTGNATGTTICSGSAYSFTVTKTIDGIYSFSIYQRDAAQNVSPSVSLVWVRKTLIPSPAVLVPTSAVFRSMQPLLTIVGACESNATVTLSGDAVDTTPCVNATFSFTVPKAADGTYNIQITQTDPAGNSASIPLTWVKKIITPVDFTNSLAAGGSKTFTFDGGSDGYVMSVPTHPSGASASPTGLTYVAGQTANVTDVLRITDSLNSYIDFPISIVPGVADHFNIVAGNAQTKTVGQVLTTPIQVKIVDRYNNGVANRKVLFQITNGDAKLNGSPIQTSDAAGNLTVGLRMGISHLQNTITVAPLVGLLPDLAGSGRPKLKLVENSSVQGNGAGNFGLSFPTVASPGQIVAANFGGAHSDNKHQDLAVVNSSGSATLGILKNLGNGLYSSSNISTCSGPNALTTGDFNGDSLIDIAVVCNSGVVAIHKGKVDGTFNAPVTFTTAPAPVAVVAGDFRANGKLDLAVISGVNGDVEMQLGNGDGTFAAPVALANQPGLIPATLKAVDLNKDGGLDLIIVNSLPNQSISFLKNMKNGTATFQPHVDYPSGSGTTDLAIGDFNSDGWADIAVTNTGVNNIGIYLTDPVSKTPTAMQAVSTGNGPSMLVAGDFGISGFARDLAVINSSDNTIGILPNLTVPGDASVNFDTMVNVVYSQAPAYFVAAQTNGDLQPDLVGSIQSSPSAINIRPGQSQTKFGSDIKTATNPVGIVAAHLITTGTAVDLAVLSQTSNTVQIFQGTGNGLYTQVSSFGTSAAPTAIAAGDMNDDGIMDLVVTNKSPKTVSVFLGRGDGTYQAALDSSVGNLPAGVVLRDFNADGKLDIAVINTNSNSVSVLLGIGDGTVVNKIDYQVGLGPMGLESADVNNDGILDLITANNQEDTVGVLLGTGSGTFQSVATYSVGSQPVSLVAIDLNGDLNIDLAVLNGSDGTISVLRGVGDASFTPLVTLSSNGSDDRRIVAGDFHKLGRVDLATMNGDSTITLFKGNGNGTFSPPTFLQSDDASTVHDAAVVSDVNNDGIIDLIVIDNTGERVETWLGL